MPRALKELFILKAGSYVSAVDLPVTLTAKEIRSYRRMAGLTISAAARIIHVSHTAWSDWEKGKKRMRRGLLEYFILRIRAEKKIWL